jgi:hypothetical protein
MCKHRSCPHPFKFLTEQSGQGWRVEARKQTRVACEKLEADKRFQKLIEKITQAV